ncbi:MAG: GGDEF domain-containing protein [Spirochaetia bacterium]
MHYENGHTGTDHTLALLRKSSIFEDLEPQELHMLADYSDYYEFQHGEHVFERDSPAQELCIIDKGAVVIRSESEGELDIARFITGEAFGELDLMGGSTRTAAAVAEGNTRVLLFPRRGLSLEGIIHEHPSLFARVLYRLIATVASRIRSTNKLISENATWVQELRHQIHMDKLSGLYNDTYLREQLQRLFEAGTHPVTVMMVKPDNFKEINDTYGHDAGDQTLRLMAHTLQGTALPGESAVRFRGNELALLMPNTDKDTACERAGQVQSTMNNIDLSHIIETDGFSLTVSVGLCGSIDSDGETEITPETIIDTAHERALAARESGGNTIHRGS